MNSLGSESRWLRFGLAVALLLAVLSLAFLRSEGRFTLPALPCAFHAVSGLPCLFCGGTRAVCAILDGNPGEAVRLNILAFPVLVVAALIFGVLLTEAVGGRQIRHWKKIFHKLNHLAPILLLAALGWWAFHVYSALKTPKPELVDLRNPIAVKAREMVLTTSRTNAW